MLAVVSHAGNRRALDAVLEGLYPHESGSFEILDSYLARLDAPVGSPERAALVRDLAAALPGVLTALARALWRYVTGDSCDCACLPWRGVPWQGVHHEYGAIPPCSDPTHDPCHFCEGYAALDAAGADIAGCGLVEPGRHTASEIARLQAAQEMADFGKGGL